jgi:ketosteroid isomerase-like protein
MMMERMLLRFPVITFLVLFVAGQSASTPQSAVDELLAADREFSRTGAGKPVLASLLPMFADDVVLGAGATFVQGKAQAEEVFRQNPDNLTARVEWAPIRGGVSADGGHGFTFGYMTVTRKDGTPIPMKYLGYWIRTENGWRVITYRRRPRAEGDVPLELMPPSLPSRIVPVTVDAAVIETHRETLAAAERAFSDEAQTTGLAAAFTKYGRRDAVNMGGPKTAGFIVGSDAIGRAVGDGTPTTSSPVSWAADHRVFVASSGDLGVTLGYIRSNEKKDQPPVPFFTIWRRETPASPWRYIAE